MALNHDPESWARVSVDAVFSGSPAQARNILAMALSDIAQMARQVADERARCAALVREWIVGAPTTTTERILKEVVQAIEGGRCAHDWEQVNTRIIDGQRCLRCGEWK